MTSYINQICTALNDHPDSHFLILNGSKEAGFTYSASPNCDEKTYLLSKKILTQEFGFPWLGLTKAALRQTLIKMAVFNENGPPPLEFSSLEEVEELFLNISPRLGQFYKDKAKTSGKGFEGICEKIYLQWHHYFSTLSEQDPLKIKIRQAEFLTSRMADREFQKGNYIYLDKQQIFQVDKVITGRGAYISILKNVSDPSRIKIVCRGTAMRLTATEGFNSGFNDLEYEIGNRGVQACWPYISKYLEDQNIKDVEILGKSLGGAHAQRLAVLVMQFDEELLTNLTTFCSVGVGEEAESLFKELIENKEHANKLQLTVIRNGGGNAVDQETDYIPCVGGIHLGSTVDSELLDLAVYYIHPTSEEIFSPDTERNIFQIGRRFASSFSGAHLRQSTLENFNYRRLDNNNEVMKALKMGAILERHRRWIAFKNGTSFSDFVQSPYNSEQRTLSEKVVMATSALLLTLALVGFVSCLILEPGTIVYQGSGIVLTLPTVIVGGGFAMGLISIAIGSCCWWLLSTRSRKLR